MVTLTFDVVYWVSIILISSGVVSLISMVAYPIVKQRNELVRLLDKSPVQNQSLKNLSSNLGLKHATKAIQNLR